MTETCDGCLGETVFQADVLEVGKHNRKIQTYADAARQVDDHTRILRLPLVSRLISLRLTGTGPW